MKRLIFLFSIFIFNISFSQQKYYFYAELSDTSLVSLINKNSDNTISLVTKNSNVNNVLNKYKIYKFDKIAPNALSVHLQNTYIVECDNVQLINDLRLYFSSIFVMLEEYKTSPNANLYIPNDYDLSDPITGVVHQYSLDIINAKQAWDITHGSSDIKIGISDTGSYSIGHEELKDKSITFIGANTPDPNSSHGTHVAVLAAGDTDNGKGLSSIGFNSGLILGANQSVYGLMPYANMGAKVINCSWGFPIAGNGGTPSQTDQNIINDLTNQNIVVIAAAGNGVKSGGSLPSGNLNAENYEKRYYYPASYKNVISVSTVGNLNTIGSTTELFDNWIDVHKIKTPLGTKYSGTSTFVTESEISNQHNDSVDIVVPAYRLAMINPYGNSIYDYPPPNQGTSFSAPIVSGTVGLMFDVNYDLEVKEIESILKLTAVNIEDIPENLEFKGRLGAGRLNAYEAVKMADEMAKPFGKVMVTDRILYRWFYVLKTAPFEIKMQNNLVTDKAKIKFIARDNIEILSGDYKPSSEGYVELNIKSSSSVAKRSSGVKLANNDYELSNNKNRQSKLYPNANNGTFSIDLGVTPKGDIVVNIYDIAGVLVYNTITNKTIFEVSVPNLSTGIYLVKLIGEDYNETIKFVKE